MKFLVVKELNEDENFKPLLSTLLSFTLIYLFVDIFVKNHSIGFFPKDILNSFLGNEDEYIDPMQTSVFLEYWHMEIFFIMMILLILSAIYIRIHKNTKLTLVISNANLICALISLISIAITYFYIPSFVYIYFATFIIWHLLSIYISFSSIYKLYFA